MIDEEELFAVIELFEIIRASECTMCNGMFHPKLCLPQRRSHYERYLALALTIHRQIIEPLQQRASKDEEAV